MRNKMVMTADFSGNRRRARAKMMAGRQPIVLAGVANPCQT
jgi:hypothetical protein